jgi:phosphatidylglycerol lysyltransferase
MTNADFPSFSRLAALDDPNLFFCKDYACALTGRFSVLAPRSCSSLSWNADFVRSLERRSAQSGRETIVFGVPENDALELSGRYTCAFIGSEPLWQLETWSERQERKKDMRYSLNAARKRGLSVHEITPKHSQFGEILRICDALRKAWLGSKRLPPLHFAAESAFENACGQEFFPAQQTQPATSVSLTLDATERLFIVNNGAGIAGYATVRKAAALQSAPSYIMDRFVRAQDSERGTVEFLLNGVAAALAGEGAEFLSLGFAPFSRAAPPNLARSERSLALEKSFAFMEKFGGRWYNARGLEHFKSKFQPNWWTPLYCLASRSASAFAVLRALATAFLGDSLPDAARVMFRHTVSTKRNT